MKNTLDRLHFVPRLVALLVLTITCSTSSVRAGDIVGRVDILRTAAGTQEAISPWARTRRLDNTEPDVGESEEVIAVVYLEQDDALVPLPPPEEHPQVNQKDMTILPHITTVQVGTTVDFPNSDNVYHNLFSLSPARKFDLGRYAKGQSKSITFKDLGEVRIYCDIHPSMSGVVLVLPNSFFAEVHADGTYRIADVPAGTYRIHAWHETLNERVKSVTVPEQGAVEVDFTLGIN